MISAPPRSFHSARATASPVDIRVGAACDARNRDCAVPGGHWSGVWLRLGIALVIAGQAGVWSLGYNTTPLVERPAVGSIAYNAIHGGLILSALAVIGLLGPPLFQATWARLRSGRITVESLFVLSMIGAFTGSLVSSLTGAADIYYEVVPIVLSVYTAGKLVGARSRQKAFVEMARIREDFDHAFIRNADGARERRHVRDLTAGCDGIVVMPGEGIPVDGIVIRGISFVRETAMTGEPFPVRKEKGDRVLAGSYALDGELEIEVTAEFGSRCLDAVLGAVESSRDDSTDLQEHADRIMQWFLPLVILVSVGTFAGWLWLSDSPWWQALFNSMAVLLVACPCALGLATPIAIWGGVIRLASVGIVARTGRFVESLGKVSTVFFDKTGTLSENRLILNDVTVVGDHGISSTELIAIAAALESDLEHPIARAIAGAPVERQTRFSASEVQVVPGGGVRGYIVDSDSGSVRSVGLGAPAMFATEITSVDSVGALSVQRSSISIWMAIDGHIVARFNLTERLRSETEKVIAELRDRLGIQVNILSGDPGSQWHHVSDVKIDGGLTPEEKADRVALALGNGENVLYVGDGINDLSAMTHHVTSLAMGGGAALTQAVGDAVLMGDQLGLLPDAIRLARRIRSRIHGNMLFAIIYNVIGMSLAAGGVLHPVIAALLMLVSSALVSTRAFRAAQMPWDHASVSSISVAETPNALTAKSS